MPQALRRSTWYSFTSRSLLHLPMASLTDSAFDSFEPAACGERTCATAPVWRVWVRAPGIACEYKSSTRHRLGLVLLECEGCTCVAMLDTAGGRGLVAASTMSLYMSALETLSRILAAKSSSSRSLSSGSGTTLAASKLSSP